MKELSIEEKARRYDEAIKKANEVYEKIYLDKDESWHLTNPNGDSVEYTRTDAFIEKACSILNRMILEVVYEGLEGNLTQHYDKNEFIEVFRNYMKGE